MVRSQSKVQWPISMSHISPSRKSKQNNKIFSCVFLHKNAFLCSWIYQLCRRLAQYWFPSKKVGWDVSTRRYSRRICAWGQSARAVLSLTTSTQLAQRGFLVLLLVLQPHPFKCFLLPQTALTWAPLIYPGESPPVYSTEQRGTLRWWELQLLNWEAILCLSSFLKWTLSTTLSFGSPFSREYYTAGYASSLFPWLI